AGWAGHYLVNAAFAQFEGLTPADKTALVNALAAYRQGLVAEVTKYPEYELQDWTKAQLTRAYTVPRMGPDRNSNIPLLSFLACPRFLEESDPWGASGPDHVQHA